MADKFASMRNLRFLLYETLDVCSLTRFPYFHDHGREVFDMVLDAGLKLARDLFYPNLQPMDRAAPYLEKGRVKVHSSVREILKACGEGGWMAAHAPYDNGGQQLPMTIATGFRFLLSAANYSASVYPFLTTGAAHLIESFASEELKQTYIPKMHSGDWQGTMAMTEPDAGSSLTDLTTAAEPTDKGYYKIKGQKIFISAADHDGAENVVNLMLVRIKGAPAGIKGISLFIVPNMRPKADGGIEYNDVSVPQVFHKLGYRGTPLTQLSLGDNGDCRGWLVGEPHKGLSYMFQMMNEARIDVGMGAAAIATAAYYAALQYTNERLQGRKIDAKDPSTPQIPIIQHADVKRMLMFQKSVVEGALGVILQCAMWSDLVHQTSGEEKEKYELLLDLLTPVAKSYPSEMGVQSISQSMQCLGGYGYCDEFPIEQYYRDARIHPIHEGTTGIQGMDLLGRKVVMKNGKAMALFLAELEATIEEARATGDLECYASDLECVINELKEVTMHLIGFATSGKIEQFLSDATLYLEAFSNICVAWQWLKQGLVAYRALKGDPKGTEHDFYQGKIMTLSYYFVYELPKTAGLFKTLKAASGVTVAMEPEWFRD